MRIDFVIQPDETGKGRVIVDGRFYGLPLDAVLDYKRLRDKEAVWNEPFEPATTAGHAEWLVHNVKVTGAPPHGSQ